MSPSRSDRFRRFLIIGCLTAALALVLALGYEAITAARAQREAVEGVLQDYATLAAEQYARNVGVMLDYEWFYPVFQLLGSGLESVPRLEGADRNVDPETEVAGQRDPYRLGDLAATLFEIDSPTAARYARVDDGGDPDGGARGLEATDLDALRTAVSEHAAAEYVHDWPYAFFLHAGSSSEPAGVAVVYRRVGDDPFPIVGFVAPEAALRDALSRAVTAYELLPPTLTDGAGSDPLVRVAVLDASGAVLFAHGPEGSPAVGARMDLDPYRAGFSVRASIPASSADRLVVGGLPYSRLPLVAGMLLLAVALLGAGGLLWRRERELIVLREQFVAGASHELRTPLAQIRMFAETLRLRRVRSEEEQQRSLEIIDREARRLSLLVENLLQFSSPARPTQRFAPEQLDVRHLVLDVVEGFRPLAAARGARIATNVGDGADQGASAAMPHASDVDPAEAAEPPITLAGDRDMLRQVLLNLLDNAVKYGPEGQTVDVELGRDADHAVIGVTDQGPGIRPSDRELAWRRFWRGPSANGITGTGIGLALVQELVALHGGTVAIADAPDGGARFEIRLPLGGP